MLKTGNLELIKKLNRSLVLELIRSEQPISRANIAKKLKLSRSTVSAIVDELLKKKFVIELGLGGSTSEGGRRGMELGFNPDSAYGIGVDIGGTKVLVVITNLDGKIIYEEKLKTPKDLSEIIQLVKNSIEKSPIFESDIISMGVGLPATMDVEKGFLIDAPALGFRNIHVKELFEQSFPFPVFINNDVNCAALGERWLGSGGNSDNVVFIAFGTGVGSAIIANGHLIQGHKYSAGEIGYFISHQDVINGKRNVAGEFGTFENKTSGTALANKGFPPEELFKEYALGNEAAISIVEEFVMETSIAIANIVSLLNPEKVIIGGGVSESLHIVLEEIKKRVDQFTPLKTEVELAKLGGYAGSLGAIAYAFERTRDKF
jgi:glucokinase